MANVSERAPTHASEARSEGGASPPERSKQGKERSVPLARYFAVRRCRTAAPSSLNTGTLLSQLMHASVMLFPNGMPRA